MNQRAFSLACVMILAIVLSGCGAMTGGTSEPDLWGPFRSQSNWIVDDGTLQLELSGFERGHRPGLESDFELTIDNRLAEDVDTSICVFLVDEDSIIQPLGAFEIQLEPGAAVARGFTASFDAEIEPRPYGLAVILEDWGAVVVTVRLGIPDEEAGPWLDVSGLRCDFTLSEALSSVMNDLSQQRRSS